MSDKKENKIEVNTNLIRRYPANYEFDYGNGFHAQTVPPQKKLRVHPSITDKESYRLQLASMRGAMASLTPEKQKGLYMFEDGKYNPSKDISHILRKDLSLVEIDEYIYNAKQALDSLDKETAKQAAYEIEQLNSKREEILNSQKETKKNNSSVGE